MLMSLSSFIRACACVQLRKRWKASTVSSNAALSVTVYDSDSVRDDCRLSLERTCSVSYMRQWTSPRGMSSGMAFASESLWRHRMPRVLLAGAGLGYLFAESWSFFALIALAVCAADHAFVCPVVVERLTLVRSELNGRTSCLREELLANGSYRCALSVEDVVSVLLVESLRGCGVEWTLLAERAENDSVVLLRHARPHLGVLECVYRSIRKLFLAPPR